ncbi:MAG: MTH895/ArsE family thioredoxin-like protein [Acidithiobacillales bacterium]
MSEIPRKKIEILGPGCIRCKETYRVVQHVVETEGLPFDIVKVESMDRMIELGLLATPGIAIDGKVAFSGRIPKTEEVRKLLTAI